MFHIFAPEKKKIIPMMLTKVRPFHKIWRKSAEVWDDRYITNHLLCLLVTTWPASTTNFTTTMNGFPCRGFCGASGSPCLPSPPRPEVKAVTRPPAAPPLHWQSASHKPLRLNSWSRVVATPSKCPPQNGTSQNDGKKMAFLEPEFKKYYAQVNRWEKIV